MLALPAHLKSVDYFLRADPAGLGAWFVRRDSRLVWFCVLAVLAGGGSYGAVMGSWWAPLQACYVAIKLPLLILLTTLGNGLLNGMLAPLLGLNISFRQSDGSWMDPISLGSPINTDQLERFPAVSPDGRYLFFTRDTPDHDEDVFWVSASIIDNLREKSKTR